MDIPYTLYYLLIEELRDIVKSIYVRSMPFDWEYEYIDIMHIEDVDNKEKGLPRDIVAQIDFSYSSYKFLWNKVITVNHIWINQDGKYIIDKPDLLLQDAIDRWIKIVRAEYLISK